MDRSELTSVGPSARRPDIESRVIPDPEFYDVGRSVSGWYNFGGIPSIRRFVSTRFQSRPPINPSGLDGAVRHSNGSDSTLSFTKGVGFAMVNPKSPSSGFPAASGEPPRRRKVFFVLGGMVLVAIAAAAIVFSGVAGSNAEVLEPATATPTSSVETRAPSAAATLPPFAGSAPTTSPTKDEDGNSRTPTASPTRQNGPSGLYLESWLNSKTISTECCDLFCFGERLRTLQRMVVVNPAPESVTVSAITADVDYFNPDPKDEPVDVGSSTRRRSGNIAIAPGANVTVEMEFVTKCFTGASVSIIERALESCALATSPPWRSMITFTLGGNSPAQELQLILACGQYA